MEQMKELEELIELLNTKQYTKLRQYLAELNEADIEVEFVRPSLYDLYNTQKIVETKMAVYKAALGDDNEFSRITAMKKYLGFTDAEVKENFMNVIEKASLK